MEKYNFKQAKELSKEELDSCKNCYYSMKDLYKKHNQNQVMYQMNAMVIKIGMQKTFDLLVENGLTEKIKPESINVICQAIEYCNYLQRMN